MANVVMGVKRLKHTTYNTTLHIVEIERERMFSFSDAPKDLWYWEITLCNNGPVTKSRAYEQSRDAKIPWTELESANPLTEVWNSLLLKNSHLIYMN